MWRWLAGGAVVLLLGLTTWHPPAPAALGVVHPIADGPALAAGPRPALPWEPGRPQLGVQVYWVNSPADTTAVAARKAQRVFDHVVGLEANAVTVSFPFYSETITSSAVSTDARTPAPARLAAVVDEAHASGLRVAIRPLLDERNLLQVDDKDWRGRLDPDDRDAWFASYGAFLEPYLVMAQRHRVHTVVIGAELNALQTDPRWPALVERARAIYDGELAWAANWDAYAPAVAALPVDTVGVDAYPRLGLAPDATGARMRAAWTEWLRATLAAGPGPTVLYEVGAAAEARTLEDPAVPHRDGDPLDEGVQARWFGAACAAARDLGLTGIYMWKIELDVEPALADPVGDLHDSFLGRAAETEIRRCFAAWSDR